MSNAMYSVFIAHIKILKELRAKSRPFLCPLMKMIYLDRVLGLQSRPCLPSKRLWLSCGSNKLCTIRSMVLYNHLLTTVITSVSLLVLYNLLCTTVITISMKYYV